MAESWQGVEHSRLVQITVRNVNNIDRAFQGDYNQIPIVVIPRQPKLLQHYLNIPSGKYVLWQKWHKNMGRLDPGVHWMWFWWKKVSHVITQEVITYNAPSRNCPTADNIMVDVDLSLTFKIGPDADAAANFVYNLGAHRLDEYLSSQTEELVRDLVYSVPHNKVNDLREDFASDVLQVLNAKVGRFGVLIMNVKITDVRLPRSLQERLETTTSFQTRIAEQEKSHENKIRVLEDEAVQQLEMIQKNNARKIQELTAECQRYSIKATEMEESAKGQMRVDAMNARSKSDVAITKAKGELEVAKVNGMRQAEELVRSEEIESQRRRRLADQQYEVMILESEARLVSAENAAKAMVADAEAEKNATDNLVEKRKYELEWKRLDVLRRLAGTGRRVVSGAQAKQILSELCPKPSM